LQVSLFIACYNDALFPQTGRAVVRVLRRLGIDVRFDARQTCCGQMHWNTGYADGALPLIRNFVHVFRDADAVVIPSASCAAMIREYYGKAAEEAGDSTLTQDVESLLPRVFEFSEFLVKKLGVEDVGAFFPHRVTYHASCHSARSLNLGDVPLRLLRNVRGLEYAAEQDPPACCGFGGTFSIKNADVSSAMLVPKINSILNTRAEICTAVDNSCLMHIYGALHRQRSLVKAMHLAEILASGEGA